MRVFTLVLVMVLVAVPALPQEASPPRVAGDATPEAEGLVEISDSLQRVFDLVKQPGFHPELLELLKMEVTQETATPEEEPSEGLQSWHWVLIAVGIAAGVILLVGALSPCGFQRYC